MSEWYGQILYYLTIWQKQLNSEIATSFRQLDDQGIVGVALVLGVAFLYGVVHAVGPGHGKAVVGSYFLSQGRKISKAFQVGYLVAIIHAASALLLTFVIYYLIEGAFRKNFESSMNTMYGVSGGMIVLIGLYLLYEAWKERRQVDEEIPSGKKPYAIALSIGIVPCPGVMTVLLFSLMLGHLVVGVLAAIMMSIGMGLTISVAGILAQQTTRVKTINSKAALVLRYFSPLLVIGIGLFLLGFMSQT